MPRASRAQRFLIDPLAVTRDPVRRAMSPAAQGVYDTLWLESWLEKEPGVLPGEDIILAGLAQVSLEVWLGVREEVKTGFVVERDMSRVTGCDMWICTAVRGTKMSQDEKRDRWRKRKRRSRERERDIEA